MNILDFCDKDGFDYFVSYVVKYVHTDYATAKDVYQEVFLKLYKKFGEKEIEHADVCNFIKTCLKNRACDFFSENTKQLNYRANLIDQSYIKDTVRNTMKLRSSFVGDTDLTKESDFGELEKEALREILELVPAQRAVLKMHYFERMTYAQIAKKKSRSQGWVKKSIHDGKKKLKQVLKTLQKSQPLLLYIERGGML